MKNPIARLAFLPPFIAALATISANAQTFDYNQRTGDMTALSGIFGELHHIRRMCEPRRESDVWRERMKKLIELEQPTSNLQQQLVNAFNKGYRSAQTRFDRCDRRADDYAAARAAEGDFIVTRLMEPLHEAASEDLSASPFLWTDEKE